MLFRLSTIRYYCSFDVVLELLKSISNDTPLHKWQYDTKINIIVQDTKTRKVVSRSNKILAMAENRLNLMFSTESRTVYYVIPHLCSNYRRATRHRLHHEATHRGGDSQTSKTFCDHQSVGNRQQHWFRFSAKSVSSLC